MPDSFEELKTIPVVKNTNEQDLSITRLLYRLWRRFLAFFRISDRAICEESIGLGEHNDYHDYPDGVERLMGIDGAMHFYRYTCARCGKRFQI